MARAIVSTAFGHDGPQRHEFMPLQTDSPTTWQPDPDRNASGPKGVRYIICGASMLLAICLLGLSNHATRFVSHLSGPLPELFHQSSNASDLNTGLVAVQTRCLADVQELHAQLGDDLSRLLCRRHFSPKLCQQAMDQRAANKTQNSCEYAMAMWPSQRDAPVRLLDSSIAPKADNTSVKTRDLDSSAEGKNIAGYEFGSRKGVRVLAYQWKQHLNGDMKKRVKAYMNKATEALKQRQEQEQGASLRAALPSWFKEGGKLARLVEAKTKEVTNMRRLRQPEDEKALDEEEVHGLITMFRVPLYALDVHGERVNFSGNFSGKVPMLVATSGHYNVTRPSAEVRRLFGLGDLMAQGKQFVADHGEAIADVGLAGAIAADFATAATTGGATAAAIPAEIAEETAAKDAAAAAMEGLGETAEEAGGSAEGLEAAGERSVQRVAAHEAMRATKPLAGELASAGNNFVKYEYNWFVTRELARTASNVEDLALADANLAALAKTVAETWGKTLTHVSEVLGLVSEAPEDVAKNLEEVAQNPKLKADFINVLHMEDSHSFVERALQASQNSPSELSALLSEDGRQLRTGFLQNVGNPVTYMTSGPRRLLHEQLGARQCTLLFTWVGVRCPEKPVPGYLLHQGTKFENFGVKMNTSIPVFLHINDMPCHLLTELETVNLSRDENIEQLRQDDHHTICVGKEPEEGNSWSTTCDKYRSWMVKEVVMDAHQAVGGIDASGAHEQIPHTWVILRASDPNNVWPDIALRTELMANTSSHSSCSSGPLKSINQGCDIMIGCHALPADDYDWEALKSKGFKEVEPPVTVDEVQNKAHDYQLENPTYALFGRSCIDYAHFMVKNLTGEECVVADNGQPHMCCRSDSDRNAAWINEFVSEDKVCTLSNWARDMFLAGHGALLGGMTGSVTVQLPSEKSQ
eukprot:TRINITY_DN91849_c0_g1_i1.p1 TRINITY_DN91849_c0_g1~~TRINITY_DN91849_c0_g1_i1.p1  ORF type:complete len:922 (-),score=139.93 TRINITY_DN91849_c0_g1_i1:22-2787(-)